MPKKANLKCYFGCVIDGPLHTFPRDTERFTKWKDVLDMETQQKGDTYILNSVRLCYKHFESVFRSHRSHLLTRNAVPTLNLVIPPVQALEPIPSTSYEQPEISHQIISTPDPLQSVQNQNKQQHVYVSKRTSQSVISSKKKYYYQDISQKSIDKMREKIEKLTEKCNTQKKQIKAAKGIASSKSFLKFVEKLPTAIKTFTSMQTKYKKKSRGRRFTNEEKILALTIYKQGPKVYKLLRKMFVLPAKRTLLNILSTVTFKPGLNQHIFNNLKEIVGKMPQEKRLVNLLFDEVSLAPGVQYNQNNDEIMGLEDFGEGKKHKKLADHALVFMIKGIKGKTKQPICFTFCESTTKKYDLKELIIQIIRQLRQTGLKVICTICDQAATNVSVIKDLQEETRIKYMKQGKEYKSKGFEIDEITVYPLFDPPHLLKGVRNNLLIKNAQFMQDGKMKCAKWNHLELLLNIDEGEDEIRLINKLTENHIKKDKIPKMKVKFAAQVFSQRVSGAMKFLSRHNILPAECEDTADFLLIFDKLFDSFNGHNYREDSKIYKSGIKNNSPHFKLWTDLLPILESIKFQSIDTRNGVEVIKNDSIPSVKNWIHNIKCFNELWLDLKNNHNITSLIMRNFNQDPLEIFFSSIRSNGVRNINPNCNQFIYAFKTLIINNFNSPHSPSANCENDEDNCMQSLKNFVLINQEEFQPDFACHVDSLLNVVSEIRNSDSLLHAESKKYVTGSIIKKCKTKIFKKCRTCMNDFIRSDVDFDSFNYEIDYTKKSLFHPSNDFNHLMNEMYYVIVACLREFPESDHIKQKINFCIDFACDFSIISCHKHKSKLVDFVKKIAINILIHSWCNGVNRILNGKYVKFDERDKIKKQAFDILKKKKKSK